jgi:hypothetical protein
MDRSAAAASEPAEHRDLRARRRRTAAAARDAVAGRSAAISDLQAHVDQYLRLRRGLGFKLKEEERLLAQLVRYLEAADATTVTGELAISCARLPEGVHPNQSAKRLRIARGFAAYLQTIDPTAEIPPRDVFPTRRQRATRYLFSQQDICRLLADARRCDTRCARRAMRRCSGCWPCRACGSARRSR